MSVPWRLAGAVGVAGGITTLAVKTIRNKAAESEAAKGRAALLGMNMEGITSGDALDLPRNHAKQEIVGDWKIYTKPDGRVFYEHIPTRKQQWRTPDELKGREEAEALPAVN